MPSDIAKLLEDARLEWLSYDAPATEINWYWRRRSRQAHRESTTKAARIGLPHLRIRSPPESSPTSVSTILERNEVEKQPTVPKKRGRHKGSKPKQPLPTLVVPVAEEERRGQSSFVDRDDNRSDVGSDTQSNPGSEAGASFPRRQPALCSHNPD
ncbi:hypothetical protein PG996_004759 [Apiospora saccharicola]|uniref:Uncharacterized protein n=1 Tax=Apiospora saccharicola TaxID=335842 RepID=A0ABR1W8T0_9PEZI